MVVCYCLDEKLLPYLERTANTLIRHNKDNLTKIHIVLSFEADSEYAIKLPKNDLFQYHFFEEIAEYIPIDNINAKTRCGLMTLARLVLSKILQEDMVIYLDLDTVVRGSLLNLWNTNINDYYLAGAGYGYINAGVLLMNLKKIRDDHKDDEFLSLMISKCFLLADQDILNQACFGKILFIDSTYNSCIFTQLRRDPVIAHCTPIKQWTTWSRYFNEWNRKDKI